MDEFDQAEACGEAPSRLFLSDGDAFEALKASDDLFDARVRLVRVLANNAGLSRALEQREVCRAPSLLSDWPCWRNLYRMSGPRSARMSK